MNQQVFLGQISAAGLLLTVSTLFYSRVFAGPGWIPPVIIGILLSGALAVAVSRTSMGPVLRTLGLAIGGVLFLILAVVLPSTDFTGAADIGPLLLEMTVDGWRNTLAETLPASTAVPAAVGFVSAMAWITGAVTGVLLIRSEQSAIAAIPAILFAGISLPIAAPGGTAAYALIAGLLAASLLLSLVRAVPRSQLDGDERTRVTEFVGERMLTERLIAGAAPLILLAVLAPLLALVIPGRDEPFDPRQLRDEDIVTASAVNPLAQLKSLRESATPAFELALPAAPSAVFFDRLGLVPLDSYDGVNWSTSATYAATSTDIEVPFERSVETLSVRQEIVIIDEESPWLPAGQPVTRIEADDIWFDSDSGSLLNRSDDAARTYAIVSEVAAPDDAERAAAVADRTDPRFLELPTIGSDSPLVELGATIEGASDFERLESLETLLREELTLVNEERSGTAVGRIEEFLVNGEGYRDQFVSAFAISARQQGFPTRIMVGYRIAQEEEGALVFLDTVSSGQYDAWPEVLFEGIGWVAFDPIPPTSGEARANADDATPIPEGQPARQGPTPSADDPTENDEPDQELPSTSAGVRVLVLSGLVLVLFPLMLLLVVVIYKLLRRRYRRNLENPTERVLAGWQESKERLLEAGVDISPDMTVKEIVSAARRDLGVHASSSLSSLAPYVTTTIYSDREPSAAAADTVWDEVLLFDEQLNESRSAVQNFKARVDPRPLLEKV